MRPLVATLALALSVTACSKVADSIEEEALAWETFGEEVADGEFRPVAEVVAAAEENAGETMKMEGEVASVCKVKGCWMTMRAGDDEVRVTFKDYGFFVPKDCEGRKVRLEGTFDVVMTPVDEARHYLEDAGKHDEAAQITEPQRDYVFEATGVRMEPAPAADAETGAEASDG